MIVYYDQDVVGWKKLQGEVVCQLRVPAGTRIRLHEECLRSSTSKKEFPVSHTDFYGDRIRAGNKISGCGWTSYKFRAEKAEVIWLSHNRTSAPSNLYHAFIYEIGDIIYPTHPFDVTNEECAPGIHMFPERWMAELW